MRSRVGLAALWAVCAGGEPAPGAGGLDRDSRDLVWEAMQRSTGMTDAELRRVAEELLAMPPPSQRQVWKEHVHCGEGWCGGEFVSRLLAQLGEQGKLPARGFEPHSADPLFELWNAEDKTPFHSWHDGEAMPDDAPLGALVPEGQSLASGRIQASGFLRRAKEHIMGVIGPKSKGVVGRCLEWDTPFYTVKLFGPLCRFHDVLQYANEEAGMKVMMWTAPRGTRVVAVDIMKPPRWIPRDYGIIVCIFVLEHVPDPFSAMRGIVNSLLPGGFLLLGVPFIDGVHACPDDYLRYTPHGLRRLTESVGLEVVFDYSPGSPAFAAGDIAGMKSSYWSTEHILGESGSHPTNVFLLARKPGRSRLGPTWYNRTSAQSGS